MPRTLNDTKGNLIVLTDEEVKTLIDDAESELEERLKERYTINLPMQAIKILLKLCMATVIDNELMQTTIGVTGRDDMEANTARQIANIIGNELTGLGLEGAKLLDEIYADMRNSLSENFYPKNKFVKYQK